MTEPESGPPANGNGNGVGHRATLSGEEPSSPSLPLRNSKGWDGKLRIDKSIQEGMLRGSARTGGRSQENQRVDAAEEEQEEEEDDEQSGSEGEEEQLPNQEHIDTTVSTGQSQRHAALTGTARRAIQDPQVVVVEGEKIGADDDLLDDYDEDETDIDLNHRRVTSIPALRLERFKQVINLCLRQNELTSIHFPPSWESAESLVDLDLYDNQLAHIKGLDQFVNLTSLDLSFNAIKHIKRIEQLTNLEELYFVQNRISKIEGLDTLVNLKNLELGGNRIREIEGLEHLTKLEELYLGKNKISEIKNLSHLRNLKTLSIQSNRLTSPSLEHLSTLPALTELYVSHNLIDSLQPLSSCTTLQIIDISWNPVTSLKGLEPLSDLQELWASQCKLEDFNDISQALADKAELDTVYFEGNPLELRQKALYRNKVKLALPQVKQVDASFVRT